MHSLWTAARDELEKIAASVAELGAGVKRLGLVRVRGLKRAGKWDLGGAVEELRRMTKLTDAKLYHNVLVGGGYTTLPSKRVMRAVAPTMVGPTASAMHAAGVPNAKQTAADAIQAQVAASARKPVIAMPKGGGAQLLKHVGAIEGSTPEALRATSHMFAHHEGFERAVKPHEVSYGFGHLSPNVLMKEHNMSAKLTGPGAEEAAESLRNLRDGQGDFAALQGGARHLYGPRAVRFFEQNTRIPRAMRKDLTRRAAAGEMPGWNKLPGQP